MKKTITTMLATTAYLLTTTAVHADTRACIIGHAKAAGKYASCQSKAKVPMLKIFSSVDVLTEWERLQPAFAKCRAKYAEAWGKLKAKNPGTMCDTTARFVDNGDGTVTDHLTGLVWEKKTTTPGSGENLSDRHDVDNTYSWSSSDGDLTDEDGTAFTDFLADLNSGGGFAGTNDWRLPTMQELQTILLPETFPCATTPCVVSELGPDVAAVYWSATSFATAQLVAWNVGTGSEAYVFNFLIGNSSDYAVRAVRSGS